MSDQHGPAAGDLTREGSVHPQAATVWVAATDTPEVDTGAGAADGDVVVRRDGDDLVIGRLRGGQVHWLPGSLPVAQLPAGAAPQPGTAGDGLVRAQEQAALLTAVDGVETAMLEAGG